MFTDGNLDTMLLLCIAVVQHSYVCREARTFQQWYVNDKFLTVDQGTNNCADVCDLFTTVL